MLIVDGFVTVGVALPEGALLFLHCRKAPSAFPAYVFLGAIYSGKL